MTTRTAALASEAIPVTKLKIFTFASSMTGVASAAATSAPATARLANAAGTAWACCAGDASTNRAWISDQFFAPIRPLVNVSSAGNGAALAAAL